MRASISVSLPEDLKRELDRMADAEGVSRSDLVREAVRDYAFVHRFRALRRELMPYADAKGVHTDEDVFETLS
ncbi:MAG: ribbon-helix-helix protein, CopG family [Longimicrobiales bacterium]